jgi:hypothetical protein
MTIEDQTVVLRLWSRRFHDLARLRTQAVCRLHSVLCELMPGGVRKQLRNRQAIAVVDAIDTDSPYRTGQTRPGPGTSRSTWSALMRNGAR